MRHTRTAEAPLLSLSDEAALPESHHLFGLSEAEQALWGDIIAELDDVPGEERSTPGHLGASMLAETNVGPRRIAWSTVVVGGTELPASAYHGRTRSSPVDTTPSGYDTATTHSSRTPDTVRSNYASWQQGQQRARNEGLFPTVVEEPDNFVPPPDGYRAPSEERGVDQRGLTDLDHVLMERVREGLRRL